MSLVVLAIRLALFFFVTHTHTRTHARMHACTHTCTHTHLSLSLFLVSLYQLDSLLHSLLFVFQVLLPTLTTAKNSTLTWTLSPLRPTSSFKLQNSSTALASRGDAIQSLDKFYAGRAQPAQPRNSDKMDELTRVSRCHAAGHSLPDLRKWTCSLSENEANHRKS